MNKDEGRPLANVGIDNGMLVNKNGVEWHPVKKVDARGGRGGGASQTGKIQQENRKQPEGAGHGLLHLN